MIFLEEVTSSTNIWYDITLIGIGIIATLIGGIIMKLMENKFNRLGELALYYRVIQIKQQTITIRIQIKNTSHDVKFLRDICLFYIKDGEKIKLLAGEKSITETNGTVEEVKLYAKDGSYSIPSYSRDIKEYELIFIFNESIREGDEFVLTYFNDKDKQTKIPIIARHDRDWIKGYPINKSNKKV